MGLKCGNIEQVFENICFLCYVMKQKSWVLIKKIFKWQFLGWSNWEFVKWKRISCKQSARWQHLSQLKASAFFSLQQKNSCYNFYLRLVTPSGGDGALLDSELFSDQFPVRLEGLSKDPTVWLDGARPPHNGTAHLKKCKQLFEYQHLLLCSDTWWLKFL